MTRKTRLLTRIVKLLLRVLIEFIKFLKLSTTIKTHVIPELAKELGRLPEIQEIDPADDIYNSLDRIASSEKKIVAGPWIAEVGFEVLYWIPFLRWFSCRYKIRKNRIMAISRGGSEVWYSGVAANYVDAFDFYTPERFKTNNSKRIRKTGGQKHVSVTKFDKDILMNIESKFGIKDYVLLHPSLMYNLFMLFWNERFKYPMSHIESHTIYKGFEPVESVIDTSSMPDNYIAVKFYFNDSFPSNEQNNKFIVELLSRLCQTNNVIFMNTGIDLDDHAEYLSSVRNKLISFESIMTPRNNLKVQSYIISNARAFIGTFGGFSYVAPFYNVPSYAVYSHGDKLLPAHPEVAHRAIRSIKYNKFGKVEQLDRRHLNLEKMNSTSDFIMVNVKTFDTLVNIFNPHVINEHHNMAK